MERLFGAIWNVCIVFGLLIVSGWAIAWWHPDSIDYRDRIEATVVKNCDFHERPSKKSPVLATAELACADCKSVFWMDGLPLDRITAERKRWVRSEVNDLQVWIPKSCIKDLRNLR
jgi:hypothetical protein